MLEICLSEMFACLELLLSLPSSELPNLKWPMMNTFLRLRSWLAQGWFRFDRGSGLRFGNRHGDSGYGFGDSGYGFEMCLICFSLMTGRLRH